VEAGIKHYPNVPTGGGGGQILPNVPTGGGGGQILPNVPTGGGGGQILDVLVFISISKFYASKMVTQEF
jgi:hypothetical protein